MILKMRELAEEMQTFNVLGLAASIVHGQNVKPRRIWSGWTS